MVKASAPHATRADFELEHTLQTDGEHERTSLSYWESGVIGGKSVDRDCPLECFTIKLRLTDARERRYADVMRDTARWFMDRADAVDGGTLKV